MLQKDLTLFFKSIVWHCLQLVAQLNVSSTHYQVIKNANYQDLGKLLLEHPMMDLLIQNFCVLHSSAFPSLSWMHKSVGCDASRENVLLKNSYEAKNSDPWDMYIINLGINPLMIDIQSTSKDKYQMCNSHLNRDFKTECIAVAPIKYFLLI